LGTSEATVKDQRAQVMAKMQTGSVARLVRFDVAAWNHPCRQ
jgi:FixJ family two-component response regulator